MQTPKKTKKTNHPILDPLEPHLALTDDARMFAVVNKSQFRKALAEGRVGIYAVQLTRSETTEAIHHLSNGALEAVTRSVAELDS